MRRGGYREVLINRYKELDWRQWDEIVLCNDTFYGPLYPWKTIFSLMEEKELDFWGLSRNAGGAKIMQDGSDEPEHIQAYFLVINRRMFMSRYWQEFWNCFVYPEKYREAIELFEIAFTVWFSGKGFRFSSYLDENGGGQYIKNKRNPYMVYTYEMINDSKFPVIKYRSMTPANCKSAGLVLNYIENHTDYDHNLILRHLERVEQEGRMRPWGASGLAAFVKEHRKVYVFGHGQYGKGLEDYFRMKNWELSGFVVSEPREEGEIRLDDFVCEETDGLIVALGVRNTLEVKPCLEERLRKEQLLFSHM
ncbi:rhamnan synthesis F family protein [Lachnospiraceae bacterium JLR.KK008]